MPIKPIPPTSTEALLALARRAAGLAAPGMSQFEDLTLLEVDVAPNGSRKVDFRYDFDQDGHSQYDRTLRFAGRASLNAAGHWSLDRMSLEHIGEAAVYTPPNALRKPLDTCG